MRDASSSRHRLERGTSTVELALIIPTFLLLLVGVFDLAWMTILSNMTSEAAREGARAGIVLLSPDTGGCPTAVSSAQSTAISTAARRHTLSFGGSVYSVVPTAGGSVADGCYLQVRVTTTYAPVTGSLLPIGSTQLGATSRLRLA
jgi:Flp pilus assembly protein TadG